MMEVKLSYNLLRSSLIKGEVFLDISLWWREACIFGITHPTQISVLCVLRQCFWQECPRVGPSPLGQAAQAPF